MVGQGRGSTKSQNRWGQRPRPGSHKFNSKSGEGVFLRYYTNNRACRVYNKRTKVVMESINVRVDDYLPLSEKSRPEDPPIVLVHDRGPPKIT